MRNHLALNDQIQMGDPVIQRVLDWHIQQSRLYVLKNHKSRAFAHLQLCDKHISEQILPSPNLQLKYALAKAATLAFMGLHVDALHIASDAVEDADEDSEEMKTLKQTGKMLIQTQLRILGGHQELRKPRTTSAGQIQVRAASADTTRTCTRPESRFVTSRPLSAPKREEEESMLIRRPLKVTDFILDTERESLRAKSRLLAAEYQNEGIELSKKFSAAGLAASRQAHALTDKFRARSPPKTTVAALVNHIKDSHDRPIISESLRELGISIKSEKRADGHVFAFQGLLMRNSTA
jgi:hypothetical protein